MSKDNIVSNEEIFDFQDFGKVVKYMIMGIFLYAIIFSNTHVIYNIYTFVAYILGVIVYPFKNVLTPITLSESVNVTNDIIGFESMYIQDTEPINISVDTINPVINNTDPNILTNMEKIIRALMSI